MDFAGTIPAEIQLIQVISTAVVAGSNEIESSKRLIEFLASAPRIRGYQEQWN